LLDKPILSAIIFSTLEKLKGCEEEEYTLSWWSREWGKGESPAHTPV
jgi:hypothetical protein